MYDTGSIARFIASVGDWKTAPLTERECAMVAAGGPPLGNLTGPLQFGTGYRSYLWQQIGPRRRIAVQHRLQ
jgi:hypothetical protein